MGNRRKRRPILERFVDKYIPEPNTGCWLWISSIDLSGYAHFWADGRYVLAHRFAYESENGSIPEGLEVDHLCKVRSCVNPLHLEAVTHAENVRRGDLSYNNGNKIKTHCPKGHSYDRQNTYTLRGIRYCRTCKNAWNRGYYIRKKVASHANG